MGQAAARLCRKLKSILHTDQFDTKRGLIILCFAICQPPIGWDSDKSQLEATFRHSKWWTRHQSMALSSIHMRSDWQAQAQISAKTFEASNKLRWLDCLPSKWVPWSFIKCTCRFQYVHSLAPPPRLPSVYHSIFQPHLLCVVYSRLELGRSSLKTADFMARPHQTSRLVPAVKLLEIMFKNRCWPTTFSTLLYIARDADGWCHNSVYIEDLRSQLGIEVHPKVVDAFTPKIFFLHPQGSFTWGPKSQVPLMLASHNMDAKSQPLSLKKSLKYG